MFNSSTEHGKCKFYFQETSPCKVCPQIQNHLLHDPSPMSFNPLLLFFTGEYPYNCPHPLCSEYHHRQCFRCKRNALRYFNYLITRRVPVEGKLSSVCLICMKYRIIILIIIIISLGQILLSYIANTSCTHACQRTRAHACASTHTAVATAVQVSAIHRHPPVTLRWHSYTVAGSLK